MAFEEESLEYRDVPTWILERGDKPLIAPKEIAALHWLGREIKARADDLGDVLVALRTNDLSLYRITYKPKRNGTPREICAPCKNLRRLQRRINKHILRSWKPARNVFGFSGGNIEDALRPHLGNKTLLCVDFVEAFPSVTLENIHDYLLSGRSTHTVFEWVGEIERRRAVKEVLDEFGYFSWYAARILAELMTLQKRLPQGAPTSPRTFDLVCEPLDRTVQKFATKVGGTYTRYADNIFFSLPTEDFPLSVRNGVLKRIEGKRQSGPHFNWHKLRIVKLRGQAVRALGLNILGGRLHNTRAFKRRVRLAVHHLEWLLDHGMDWEEAWLKLQGQMQFARTATLPPQLCVAYAALEERIASLS